MQEPESISSSSHGCSTPVSSDFKALKSIQVNLIDNENLWTQFNQLGTEMIVTKPGRQMFPTVKVLLQNLNPFVLYKVYMELMPVDSNRYKYEKGMWQFKQSDINVRSSWLLHPQSPSDGVNWMHKLVEFNVRLTNSLERMGEWTLWLRSMHRYMIVIHVEEGSDVTHRNPHLSRAFWFPETVFFAVTTYQNPMVKELKIEKNIHAKGAKRKKLEYDGCSDENINENASDIFKTCRVYPECSVSPLSSKNGFTPKQSIRLSTTPISAVPSYWSETCNKPAIFFKSDNPHLPPIFQSHRISTPSMERIPYPIPFVSSYCSPCLHHERPQYYNRFFPLHPQSFQFCHSSSPSYIPDILPGKTNSALPPNFGCMSTACGQPAFHACHTWREGLHNGVTCTKSSDVSGDDHTKPSSTTNTELPNVSPSPKPELLEPHQCTTESDGDQSTSDESPESLSCTMADVSSSIAEAIKSSVSSDVM